MSQPRRIPRISDAEWEVMKILWEQSPQTANEVVEALAPRVSWSPRTVRTLLNRLLNKKALQFRKQGREYLYSPRVSEAECVQAESRSFLARMFGGSVTPLVVNLLDHKELSREDIEELRRILEKEGRNS